MNSAKSTETQLSTSSSAGAAAAAAAVHDNNDDNGDQSLADQSSSSSCSIFSSLSASRGYCTGGGSDRVGQRKVYLLPTLILFLGYVGMIVFLSIGIARAREREARRFEGRAAEFTVEIETSWRDYEVAALWVHESARRGDLTHRQFRELYEYLVSNENTMDIQAVEWVPNVTRDERAALEADSLAFYASEYPEIRYSGIRGLEPADDDDDLEMKNRSEQPFYFPVHYVEPVAGNEAAIDFDLYSSASRRATIDEALATFQPTLSPRLKLVQETDPNAYSVLLFHPGVPLSTNNATNARPVGDLSLVVVRLPALLARAAAGTSLSESLTVQIYDTTQEEDMQFLTGAVITSGPTIRLTNETTLKEARAGGGDNTGGGSSGTGRQQSNARLIFDSEIPIGSKTWVVIVTPAGDSFEASIGFIIMGSVLILAICSVLATGINAYVGRLAKIRSMKMEMEREKAALILKNARAEREMNDFIAHEVRNPLAAAISACSFVSSGLADLEDKEEETPAGPTKQGANDDGNEETHRDADPLLLRRSRLKEDVHIIDSSLHFINDLLRNILDMNRASSGRIEIEMSPADVKRDILEPVHTLLHRHGKKFEVLVDCPDGLIVETDRMRLKQIIVNLGSNATKFVEKGFIRLRAAVVDGLVEVYVEDSGPGIPLEKRQNLFSKYERSLDSMNQGTGIGLYLCKRLATLMKGELRLDESYHSDWNEEDGLLPGTRFVVKLNRPPMKLDAATLDLYAMPPETTATATSPTATATTDGGGGGAECKDDDDGASSQEKVPLRKQQQQQQQQQLLQVVQLPENISVLCVDDDVVLRKLFKRSVGQVVPTWDIREASNGETAIKLARERDFDLVFMDQYMASVETQMLGTEAVRRLRANGVKAKICGLSANDTREAFLEAGADAFMFKPFPCQKDALTAELSRVLLLSGG